MRNEQTNERYCTVQNKCSNVIRRYTLTQKRYLFFFLHNMQCVFIYNI